MERNIKRAGGLLVAGALLFSTAVAQQVNKNNTVNGPVTGDEYFVGSVLFSGTELPETLDASSGTSTYDLEGEGSVTIGGNKSGGFPRITFFGGTKISSTRTYDEDNVNHEWWEGAFFSPSNGRTSVDIDGADSPNGDDISKYIVETAYEFGGNNESFSFSPAATFVADFGGSIPDNTRLFVATRSAGSDVFTLNSSEHCWVEDGYCVVDISTAGSFALVREVFERCPSRGAVPNGSIGSVPGCLLTCDKGYQPDEERRYCELLEGVEAPSAPEGTEKPVLQPEVAGETIYDKAAEYEYRPGHFKYRGSKVNYDREIDTEGLSGIDRQRADKLSAGSLKTMGAVATPTQVASNNDKDTFLNYLLSFRGKGGDQNAAALSAQSGQDIVLGGTENTNNENGETYSSAPLLPSTGAAGIFWVLAAIGLGMMAFAVKRK